MVTRNCTQTAVYWEFLSMSGYGTEKVLSAPIEIKCRWDNKQQLIPTGQQGESILSRAIVTVLQDVTEGGYLFLGTLDDLNSAACIDPTLEEESFLIKQFAKIPVLGSTTEFLRKAYLSEWQTM